MSPGARPRDAAHTSRIGSVRRWLGWSGLTLLLLCVAGITLSPNPVDQGRRDLVAEVLDWLHAAGVPAWWGYAELEFTANAVMFIPIGLCVAVLLPLRRAWLALVAGAALSGLIELTQLMLLPGRFATWEDVLANTLGTTVGVVCAIVARWVVRLVVGSRRSAQ